MTIASPSPTPNLYEEAAAAGSKNKERTAKISISSFSIISYSLGGRGEPIFQELAYLYR